MSSEFAICLQITPEKLFHCFLKKTVSFCLNTVKGVIHHDALSLWPSHCLTVIQYATSLVLRALFPGNLQSNISPGKSWVLLQVQNPGTDSKVDNMYGYGYGYGYGYSNSEPNAFDFANRFWIQTKHICIVYDIKNGMGRPSLPYP